MTRISSHADVQALEAGFDATSLPRSTYDLIRRSAGRWPTGRALSFFAQADQHERTETWTYRDLLGRIHMTANFLHSLGTGPSEVVAYVLPNLPHTHLALWGAQAAGIAFAVNPMLDAAAIAGLLQESGARVVITLGAFPGSDLAGKLAEAVVHCPAVRDLVLVNLLPPESRPPLPALPGVRVHDFATSLAGQAPDRLLSGRDITPDDVSSYFCTGGTTGLPKIAMRRHGNEVANAWSAAQFMGDGLDADKTLFCGLPLFHVNGALVTGLLPFLVGAHVLLGTAQGFRGPGVIPRFWDIVAHHRVNFFSAVPTIYAALLQVPLQGQDLRSLEYGLCGAAPMPAQVLASFEQRTGLKILEGYGLTEGTCISAVNPPAGQPRTGSIGLRIPMQDMKAVLLDEQGGYLRDARVDEPGVLVIRGPNVFLGYKNPAQDAGLWLDLGDGARWLNTGDLGRQDADGYFYLTGRKKDLIIRGGHNIDPQAIEEPLHRHPAVQLAAAVGRPDAHAGELPVAYVQLKPGSQATEPELLDYAATHIGERAAVPKAVRIVPQLPMTSVGKIFKPELKLRETEDALLTALGEAGLAGARVQAVNDPVRGLLARVHLPSGADLQAADQVLGQFAVQTERQQA